MTVLPAARLGPDMDFPAQPTLGPWGRLLFDAVRRHDVDAAALAVQRGASVQALAPIELVDADAGQQAADGGYTALHLATVSLSDPARGEAQEVSLPMIQWLLDAGADPNAPTTAFPDVLTPLEGLLHAQPANLVAACALLCSAGARPTAQAVTTAAQAELPESATVVAMLFAHASATERPVLRDGPALAGLTRRPLSAEGRACVVELVRQGANLDQTVRTPDGTRLPTPAQAIVQQYSDGAAWLAQLRQLARPLQRPRRSGP